MSTSLNPANSIFLANVDRLQQQLNQVNGQMSSGKKIQTAADAPDEVAGLLQLRTDQALNQQVESNLTLAGTDANSADTALSSAIQLLQRATQLATQGATGTQTADTRATLAEEVQSLMQQMVAVSQTQVQGRFIFSGDLDGSASYQLNLSSPTGVTQVSSAAATRLVQDASGGSFAAGQTAQQIFDDTTPATTDANGNTVPAAAAADNIFAALNNLRLALLNNDQTGVQNSLNSLHAASTHLNNAQAFYGTVEDRIQTATNIASTKDTQLQTEIGNIEDTDATTAALQLSQDNAQLQASFEMQANMPRQTLFSFLG